MTYVFPVIGLLFVLLSTKFDKMKTLMLHPHSDNLFGFILGAFTWAVTSIFINLLNVNVAAWIPPVISIFSALAGGFFGMAGKDLYKAWKAKRGKR